MSANQPQSLAGSNLDLSKWAKLPLMLAVVGGLACLVGVYFEPKQFGYSYLTAFMFFLSISLGALFLIIMHHLFDTQWMVPLRRVWEHLACLFPALTALFAPIALNVALAGKDNLIYRWMGADPLADHALHVKAVLFNIPTFFVMAAALFFIWSWLAWNFRQQSLKQDQTGGADCTIKMRRYAAAGIYIFAITVTLGSVYWMKSLEHQWFSTMYGVYYFSGSVWVALATTYVLTLLLQRTGPLGPVVQSKTYHDIGVLFFAFTVFYAYIAFSQYFLIWNAALPEETFWFTERETGSWAGVGYLIIFGHFFLPFLAMLRIDAKLSLPLMVPMCIWAWIMHYNDMTFNIKPVLNPDGLSVHWLDFAAFAFIGGVLAQVFIKFFRAHPPYPQRDPRIAETMGIYVPPAGAAHPHSK